MHSPQISTSNHRSNRPHRVHRHFCIWLLCASILIGVGWKGSANAAPPPSSAQSSSSKPQASSKRPRRVSIDDDLPDIDPIAPVPTVFREVNIITKPAGAKVLIKYKEQAFPCAPKQTTPCKVKIAIFGDIIQPAKITITLTQGTKTIKSERALEGSNETLQTWMFAFKEPLPKARPIAKSITTRRPAPPRTLAPTKRRTTQVAITPPTKRPPERLVKPPRQGGVPAWMIVAGSIVIAGGIAAGVVGYALTRDNLSLKCKNCNFGAQAPRP